VPNDPRTLTASATPPNIGPRIAPATAAPNAIPSTSPRCSFGALLATHASAPAHVTVLENPCTKRARPSTSGSPATANAKLATPRRTRPQTTACFGPNRAAARPPGTPPKSAPAPNAATSSPAPVFERSNSSAYAGTSGVSAVYSIASTKMIALTRTRSRRIAARICVPITRAGASR
jgi:hypothetical protein